MKYRVTWHREHPNFSFIYWKQNCFPVTELFLQWQQRCPLLIDVDSLVTIMRNIQVNTVSNGRFPNLQNVDFRCSLMC